MKGEQYGGYIIEIWGFHSPKEVSKTNIAT